MIDSFKNHCSERRFHCDPFKMAAGSWQQGTGSVANAAPAQWLFPCPCKDVWAGGEGAEWRTRNKQTEPATLCDLTAGGKDRWRCWLARRYRNTGECFGRHVSRTHSAQHCCTWSNRQKSCAGRAARWQGRVRHLVREVAPKQLRCLWAETERVGRIGR